MRAGDSTRTTDGLTWQRAAALVGKVSRWPWLGGLSQSRKQQAAAATTDWRGRWTLGLLTWKLEAIAVAVAEPRRNDNIFEASNEEAAA